MDPWVHAQLRLAERQGLLRGPNLSPIQHLGSAVLDAVAALERTKDRDREIRLAMLASGRVEPEDVFPVEFGYVIEDDEAEIDESTDDEGNAVAVKYDFSNAEMDMTPEEVEREVAEMLAAAASSGMTSFDEETVSGEWQ